MIVEINGKLVTITSYDKKDGGKGFKDIAILTSENTENVLSGEVIKPYISGDTYKGVTDFSSFRRMEPVHVVVESSTFKDQQSYKLLDLQKVENKKQ